MTEVLESERQVFAKINKTLIKFYLREHARSKWILDSHTYFGRVSAINFYNKNLNLTEKNKQNGRQNNADGERNDT
ncbi:MAG: hypothetical protein LH472_09375 [Pyrinomonadaceae bacterium]|nr:hypothetical protein [Pyrinomonadaceae bacterium]